MTTPNGHKYLEDKGWPWPGKPWPWCLQRGQAHDPHIANEGNTRCPGEMSFEIIEEE